MNNPGKPIQVGDQDPELNSSPVQDENDEQIDYDLHENVTEAGFCLFNGQQFSHGSFVCSGSTLLRCDRGVWIVSGTCDPENP